MKKIAFTLCSNNYLAQAKTLGDSLLETNPDAHFIIGLVDKRHPMIDYDFFNPHEVIAYDELGYPNFAEMISMYNIIEFNTAVKPFYFEYLFNRDKDCSMIYYIDPDIEFFGGLDEPNSLLSTNSFVLTPHILVPQMEVSLFETIILSVGVYNLGFIGISRSDNSSLFLKWWMERLKSYCFNDVKRGLFVDQIWVNFITILFEGSSVLKSPGYNMACWNFHERKLLKVDGEFFVNNTDTRLVFFHFSGFNPINEKYLCKMKHPALTFEARPDLLELFKNYRERIIENGYVKYSQLKPLLKFGETNYTLKKRIGKSLRFRTVKAINRLFNI